MSALNKFNEILNLTNSALAEAYNQIEADMNNGVPGQFVISAFNILNYYSWDRDEWKQFVITNRVELETRMGRDDLPSGTNIGMSVSTKPSGCECGIHKTYGLDVPKEYHSDWCWIKTS